MVDKENALTESLNLTEAMLTTAQAEQWEAFAQLAQTRHSQLQTYFTERIPPEKAQEVEAMILRIQDLDRQILALCSTERDQLARKIIDLNSTKKVTAAYQAHHY